MKKQLGLMGSLVLAATFVFVGLSGNLALAQNNQGQNNNDQGQNNNYQGQNGQGGSYSIPEASSLLLLGAGLAGLGIWAWRRKST